MDEKFELPKIGDILIEEFLKPLEITPYRLAKDSDGHIRKLATKYMAQKLV